MSTTTLTPQKRSLWSRTWIAPLVALFLFLGLWELLVLVFRPPVFLLPPPSLILQSLGTNFGQLLLYGFNTFQQAFFGFLIGSSLGILVAMLVARSRRLANFLLPFAVASNSVPIVAMAPIAIVWFGIGPGSKIAIVAVMCFFPVLVSTVRGLTVVEPDAAALMRSYAATEWQIFTMLRVPTALPFVFSALKICTALSMIGAIVAEFFGGAVTHLGVFIKTQASILKTQDAWAAIVIACFFGMAFYFAVALVERFAMPWHRRH